MATILAVDNEPLQLDLLQSQLIDLVIVGTALPRDDGIRVCQQIRQVNPYTPLMFRTAR